jgi:GntR family transcriptional regulator, histidine utilization repressor
MASETAVLMRAAPYRRIMEAIRAEIVAGRLRPGDRIPSENELTERFGVSRMTANRAVRELASEGLVTRLAGSGSFVALKPLDLSLLRVPDIAEEIASGGGTYGARLIDSGRVAAGAELAQALELAEGAPVFHTLIVHQAGAEPVQLEDRFVNPAFAPEFLLQDFSQRPPHAYLTAISPPEEVEQTVEAVSADQRQARLLAVPAGHTCLKVTRRTWSVGVVATMARLVAPGERWRLNVRFKV